MSQDKLKNLLTSKPAIQKGKPLELSTTAAAEEERRESATSHNRTIAQSHQTGSSEPKRVNRGYKLREDLIKRCKRLALDEERNLYEIMEDALEEYLDRHGAK